MISINCKYSYPYYHTPNYNSPMDVVFHRNCMDGAFSAYLMYMFCKTLCSQGWTQFLNHLKQQSSHESHQLQPFLSQQILVNQCEQIKEEFFHSKSEIPFHSVSMFAGDMFPIAPSAPGNVLFIVDTSPNTKEIMTLLAQRFTYVVIFDHHTTFSNCLSFIQECKLNNVFYLWNEKMCASQIVENYLFRSFGFPKNLPKHEQEKLAQQIQFVAANDLKVNQNRTSKQFTLGFYYFEIELSHQNPLLFKRLWGLDMETIFLKGQRAYKEHIECLIREVQNCQIFKVTNSKFKNTTFLAAEMTDRGLTSDLGSILAYLSVKHKFSNLAMIYKKGTSQYRISFRSHQFVEEKPKALQFSVCYGGGGHVCAGGCFISKGTFRQHFKPEGRIKPAIKITREDIQNILFKGAD